jgi:outer membrane protein TolC
VPSGGISLSPQSQFQGSVPSGEISDTPLTLSLQEAIDRGLKNNLGLLVRESNDRAAKADRIRALSALIPFAAANISETAQQINLASYGFRFPGVPSVIGPFGYSDFRASASQTIFDWPAIKNRQSVLQNSRALRLSFQDGRDLVVQAVAAEYLRIIADGALIDATRAQIATAQALFERARDQHQAGVSPAIDELRAQVEVRTQQQQLLAQENQLAKDKMTLARVIGLPAGQAFGLADAVAYAPLDGLTPDELLRRAYESRADYQSAIMQVRAAETAREAVLGVRYPTLSMTADYGALGANLGHSHGSFAVTGSLQFGLFDGGRTRADLAQADAVIKQRRDELADLKGQIDFQIRTALLDLKTAADQVAVARDNLDLADRTLVQARDRFAAGVTDNIEVVQAQESLAAANQSMIASVYAHNLAKVSLARAVGATEASLKQFMGGK